MRDEGDSPQLGGPRKEGKRSLCDFRGILALWTAPYHAEGFRAQHSAFTSMFGPGFSQHYPRLPHQPEDGWIPIPSQQKFRGHHLFQSTLARPWYSPS